MRRIFYHYFKRFNIEGTVTAEVLSSRREKEDRIGESQPFLENLICLG
jgi:hypothetical protein